MPNRILKESICTSDNLNELSEEAENFFYRLLVCCDDFGRFDGRVAIIKARCYPLKAKSTEVIESLLRMLQDKEIIAIYTVDGKEYIQMTTWEKHQQVRAKKSKFPAPVCELISNDIKRNQEIANVPGIQSNPIQSESVLPPGEVPYDDILSAFNSACPSLPKTIVINQPRSALIKAAFVKYQNCTGGPLAVFDEVFKKAEESDFLTGRIAGHDGKTFKAKFDWLFDEGKMVKVLEGDYDNAAQPQRVRELQL